MSRFVRVLLAISFVALGVRVGYVTVAKGGPCPVEVDGQVVGSYPSECTVGDQIYYNAAANRLARGEGFVEPLAEITHPGQDPPPAADHPPLTVMVLAPVSWITERPPVSWVAGDPLGTNVREHRYAMAVLGAALVLLVGLLGRRVAGAPAGLVAAGIAAVSPNVWVNDGLVMSETVTGLTVVGAMLLAFRVSERPAPVTAAVFGAVCGLAALARAELLLFTPLLLVPLVWRASNRRLVASALGAVVLVLAPWVVYNLARFEERTLLSTNDGIALAGSYCDPVYRGSRIGLTAIIGPDSCIDWPHPPGDQSEVAKIYRTRAIEYARDNLARFPVVAAARVGRTWSVFRPLDMVSYNQGEGREAWVTRLGLVAYYPTLVGAVAGAVLLWGRDRRALWILAVPAIVVTTGAALVYGQTRFRAAAEPSLAVLAAIALVSFYEDRRRRRRGSAAVAP